MKGEGEGEGRRRRRLHRRALASSRSEGKGEGEGPSSLLRRHRVDVVAVAKWVRGEGEGHRCRSRCVDIAVSSRRRKVGEQRKPHLSQSPQVELHVAKEKADLEPRRRLDHLLRPSLQLQDLQISSGMRLMSRSWFLGWSLAMLTGISCVTIVINLDLLLLLPLTSSPLEDRKRTSI